MEARIPCVVGGGSMSPTGLDAQRSVISLDLGDQLLLQSRCSQLFGLFSGIQTHRRRSRGANTQHATLPGVLYNSPTFAFKSLRLEKLRMDNGRGKTEELCPVVYNTCFFLSCSLSWQRGD